ncbi:hypothetical protein KSP40_PGU010473 [Platanthera guangdongensis]|uniref:Transcription repressor n=1 Tax=Platanthera guangdongensis TaxID=2320717 RepID=A0ABR2MJW6_9ASPA
MSLGASKKKTKGRSLFSFSCDCRNARSVSVSASTSNPSENSKAPNRSQTDTSSSSGDTLATTSFSNIETEGNHDEKSEGATSFSGLLRELRDLERNVKAWGTDHRFPAGKTAEMEPRQRHRRSRSEGRVGESVAVVKDSEDPLRDFKQSMLQMIVEKEIVGRTELRELLVRFLSLNSTRFHGIIIRAFAEIWAEVFAGYDDRPEIIHGTPDILSRSLSQFNMPRSRLY